MKKKIFVLITLMTILFQIFLPWWSMIVPCILTGYFIPQKQFGAFGLGFVLIFFVWFSYSIYIDITVPSTISEKAATLLSLKNKYILFIVSGIIGGIVGGVASLLGHMWREHKRATAEFEL